MTGIFGPTSPADDFVVDSFGVRGPTGPSPLSPLAPWMAGTPYVIGPPASFVAWGGNCYACVVDHTATVFATDLANGCWVLALAVSQAALNAAAAAALQSLIANAPTTPPPTAGELWSDGGSLSVSS